MGTASSVHERVKHFFQKTWKETGNWGDLGTLECNAKTDRKEIELKHVKWIYLVTHHIIKIWRADYEMSFFLFHVLLYPTMCHIVGYGV